MSPRHSRWWLWFAALLVLVAGWLLLRTPPGWYQPEQHVDGAGERFEQEVVDQLTTLREDDASWELRLDPALCNAFLAQRLRPWLQRESPRTLGLLDSLGPPQIRVRPRGKVVPPGIVLGFLGWGWLEFGVQAAGDSATCTKLQLVRSRVGGVFPVPVSWVADVPGELTFPQVIPLQDKRTVIVDALRFEGQELILLCRTQLAGSE